MNTTKPSTIIKRAHARAGSKLSLRAFADRIANHVDFAAEIASANKMFTDELQACVDAWFANKAKLKASRRRVSQCGSTLHSLKSLRSNMHSTRGAYVPMRGAADRKAVG